MNKEQIKGCLKPKTNKLFIVLIALLIAQFIYVNHTKETTGQEYEILFQLRSLNVIHQKIDAAFEKKNSHQSFDEIVQHTKDFEKTLKVLYSHTHNEIEFKNGKLDTFYTKIKEDYHSCKDYIERYTSWNSLSINSTRLLYDMHRHLKTIIMQSALQEDEETALNLLDEITTAIALIDYDGLANAELLEAKMKAFEALAAPYSKLSKRVKQQYRHIKVVLEAYERMQALQVENSALELSTTINQLYTLLLNDLKQKDKDNDINFSILNIFIVLLLISIFLSSRKGAKLHYEVCNLNYKLEDNINSLQSVNKEMSELIEKFDHNVIASKTDTKGIITYVSHAFCTISGYSKEELLGKPHNIVRHPDMPKEMYQHMWATIQAGKEWKGEIKNRTKDNNYYWVDVTITPELDTDGKLVGYSAIRHDITAKKALEVLSRSLEEQVLFRTQELEKMIKKVELLSITDELTQLHNRRYYSQVFDGEVQRAKRDKQFFNYVLLDIDNFKAYNDFYGHQFGDYALQEVAKVFMSMLHRPSDFCFRMGGEEFVIIFTSESKEKAIAFSQKIIDSVSSLKIEHVKNLSYDILTISGGLVSYPPDTKNIIENKTYKQADELLYLAKEQGRNRVKF